MWRRFPPSFVNRLLHRSAAVWTTDEVESRSQRLQKIRSSAAQKDIQRCLPLLSEAVEDYVVGGNRSALDSSTVSFALYLCEQNHTDDEASLAALRRLVKDVLPNSPHLWSESSLVVALRYHCRNKDVQAATSIVQYFVGQGAPIKHRVVEPYLQLCHMVQHWEGMRWMLSVAPNVELSAIDLERIVQCAVAQKEPLSTLHALLQKVSPYLDSITHETAQSIAQWRGRPLTELLCCPTEDSHQCDRCRVTLRGFPCTTADRNRLLLLLEESLSNPQKKKFAVWKKFVEQPLFAKVNVLIDGANIGYLDLQAWYAVVKRQLLAHRRKVDLSAIPVDSEELRSTSSADVPVYFQLLDVALEECRANGLRPLIVLHERHSEEKNLLPVHMTYLNKWRKEQVVFFTATGLNDDVCWLYAALRLSTPTDSTLPERRDVFVLTNDLMRDHHLCMLHGKAFAAWRDRHVIQYRCSFDGVQSRLSLQFPRPYTRCLQHDALGECWHLPILENNNKKDTLGGDEWMCLH